MPKCEEYLMELAFAAWDEAAQEAPRQRAVLARVGQRMRNREAFGSIAS